LRAVGDCLQGGDISRLVHQLMQTSKTNTWIQKSESRKKVLTALKQPLTAKQISKKTGLLESACSDTIARFVRRGLLTCLNPKARTSRLYWLTETGKRNHRKLCRHLNLPQAELELPDIDWDLYGWLCFKHRSAVIRAMSGPMQPSEIKRALRNHGASIRISANNVRDIIKLFLAKGLVRVVKIKNRAHLRYELIKSAIEMQQLLIKAESPF